IAPRPGSPQVPGQLPPKRPPRLDVEGAVDRLVGDLHRLIVGVADPQPTRDLLWRVVSSEALLDQPAKLAAELEPRRPRPPRAAPGLAVCGVGAVAPPAAATLDLTRDRRVRATQRPGDRAGRAPTGDRARDLLALLEAQAPFGAPAGPRPDASRPRQVIAHAPPRKAEPAPDLAIAQPLRPQPPDPVLCRLAQAVAPRHHRTPLVGQRAADSPGWCGGGLRPPMRAALSCSAADGSHERRGR